MLEENWNATQAFLLCQQTWAIGFGGGFALGFSAQEIDAACRLLGISADELTTTAAYARHMGRVAAEELNRRKR